MSAGVSNRGVLAEPLLRVLRFGQTRVSGLPRFEELLICNRSCVNLAGLFRCLGNSIKREPGIRTLFQSLLESSLGILPFAGGHHCCRFAFPDRSDIEGRLMITQLFLFPARRGKELI